MSRFTDTRDIATLVILPAVAAHLERVGIRYGVTVQLSDIDMLSRRNIADGVAMVFEVACTRIAGQMRRDFGYDWQACFRGGGCE